MELALWLCVNAVGQLWRRFIQPYSVPPLCLGRLCDSSETLEAKQSLASWYFNLKPCCRSESFCKPLLQKASAAQDLCPNGRLHGVLVACSRTKNTNIELENNFARAQSIKKTCRGREDHSTQLAAKHLLAEVKLAHSKDILRLSNSEYAEPAPKQSADQRDDEPHLALTTTSPNTSELRCLLTYLETF